MAWRFPAVLPVSGDVLHPGDWNRNIDAYSSELNGFIDRDNLKSDSVKGAMMKANAFVKVYSSSFTDAKGAGGDPSNDFDISMRTTAWQSTDTSTDGDKMPLVNITADTDGLVQCDFHASYQWKFPIDPQGGSHAWFKFDDDTEVFWPSDSATATPLEFGEMSTAHGERTTDEVKRDWDDKVLDYWRPNAAHPVWGVSDTSVHFIPMNGSMRLKAKWFNNGFVESPGDTDCVAFRMLVDGIVIAETGWLSIGMYRNGVHLTGASPISAGTHIVETQVRAGKVDSSSPTSGVLAAAIDLTGIAVISDTVSRVPNTGGTCRVRGRALTVIFRKR
tara:strand:+ start:1403 stop:2398 length:996 start_codon:yes stop_codon:yes gene_type:complete